MATSNQKTTPFNTLKIKGSLFHLNLEKKIAIQKNIVWPT
ncbi:hypothetical protein P278_02280 [Zhouia amylolytica AD3]|uniref:Uncharacterized protein n=1 Tax=Zhouia amylolytica AD3 TaxID=1286632 RepID=W2UU07_9FLAO|nr:hypothetical protein P278_02280 [Zhouia amylolytica AD3]